MILVDTSVWIRWLNTPGAARGVTGDTTQTFVICGPVLQEVLQGLRPGPAAEGFRRSFLALPMVGDPVAASTFARAAGLFADGRRRGFTIRSSVDCLIAAIAIEEDVPVCHWDRDFGILARFSPLRVAALPLR